MRRTLLPILVLSAVIAAPVAATAAVTPFGERVNAAINRGLDWFRANQAGNGGWGNPTGLGILCFLEKRASADWNAPAVGYAGMDAADQGRVRNAVRYCIDSIGGLSQGGPSSYETGSCLMGISLYLVTGGPDNVGARVVVSQAVANGVAALRGTQGNAGQNIGGWNYNNPGNDGDLSTTQFAMAGLSAASSRIGNADDTLPNALQFIQIGRAHV